MLTRMRLISDRLTKKTMNADKDDEDDFDIDFNENDADDSFDE